jgi:hypothetical protein
MKIIPGTPKDRNPLWFEPDPYYGPKDQSQDVRGREMEMKYTGGNLSRYHKLQFEKEKKASLKKQESKENKS